LKDWRETMRANTLPGAAEARLVVTANFSRIYLGGIPSLLNDDGAFMSFICCLTAMEALGGFIKPKSGNGQRFKVFVREYMPEPLRGQGDDLWKLRNAAVHGFSPGPYVLTHHNTYLHLSRSEGRTVLNAEDFYAALVTAARSYFERLAQNSSLQAAFAKRMSDPHTGVMVVAPASVDAWKPTANRTG
jgi:hypothetical protein